MVEPNTFEPDWVVHPGATLAECLEVSGLTLDDLHGGNVTEDYVRRVFFGTAGVNESLAEKLGSITRECGSLAIGSKQFWLNLQANYDRDCERLGLRPNNGMLYQSVTKEM